MSKKDPVVTRLNRIEGQIKGIKRMVQEEKFCGDILIQVSAVKSALNNLGGIVLENYMQDCLRGYLDGETTEEELDRLIQVMLQYTK